MSKLTIYPGNLLRHGLSPPRLRMLARRCGQRPLTLLDVGCGTQSCGLTRRWLNLTEYHGLDVEPECASAAMDRFFALDLERSELTEVPTAYYDAVIMSHVIEHLHDGLAVIERLMEKPKPGGWFYLETPSYRSYNLPSAQGVLNFYDDPTHVRVYDIRAIIDRLATGGYRIERWGRRRDWRRIMLLAPPVILFNLGYYPLRRRLYGQGLWDLVGMANFVLARRR